MTCIHHCILALKWSYRMIYESHKGGGVWIFENSSGLGTPQLSQRLPGLHIYNERFIVTEEAVGTHMLLGKVRVYNFSMHKVRD